MSLANSIHKNTVHVQMQFLATALDLLKCAKVSEAYGRDCSGIEEMLNIADSLGIDSGVTGTGAASSARRQS